MSKGSRKKYDAKRAEVIKYIAKKFEVTEGYVRQCIAGTSTAGRAEDIQKDFRMKYNQVNQVLS